MTYENADKFYRHVEVHAECIPDGNCIPGGCTCVWEGKFMLSVYLMVTSFLGDVHVSGKVGLC